MTHWMSEFSRPTAPTAGGKLLLFAFLLGFVASACNGRSEAGPGPSKPPPAKVVLGKIVAEPLVETRSFFGEVHAESDASLSAAEAGRVTKVRVVAGDQVKKGQVLIELDDQLARVQLNEAVASRKETAAQLAQADLEVEKYTQMRDEHVVSLLEASRKASEAQSLTAASQGQSARVARGAELLRRHRILAPFAGTVAYRHVDPGDWLAAGQVALQLLTASHVEIEVRVPAAILDALDRVRTVTIVEEGHRATARIESAVNALDPRTRTALLRVLVEGHPDWLRVGASVNVEFAVSRSDGITIPRDALVYGIAAPRVYRVKDGIAESVDVKVLAAANERALVASGELHVDDQLVVRGNERLRPGQPVTEESALVPASAP